MDKVFFKIIITNYNNMPYIKKCLDSILNQTFQNFKIILVDDLSDDTSYEFAQMYERKYKNKITVIQLKEKGYAGACRNAGLDINISSQYIFFIDSDDWLYNAQSLQHIYNTVIENNYPDLIRCQYEEIVSSNIIQRNIPFCPTIEQLPKLNSGPSCNCINASTLGKIRFQEKLYRNNDVLWFLQICDKVKSIATTLQNIFIYNRNNPISCQNSPLNGELKMKADRIMIETLENKKFKRYEVNRRRDLYIKEILNRQQRTEAMNKKASIDQIIENSFVISFNDQKLNLMKKVFSYAGLKMPKKYLAFHNKDLSGPYNCILSHVSIVRMAKSLDLPFVIIYEDDAYPCKYVYSKMKEVFMNIPKDASIVLLGWSNEAKPYGKQKFDQKFNKITRIISGAHAYIVFNDGYDKYLNAYQNDSNQTADGIFSTIEGSYILDKPLFIQYCNIMTMNKHCGYIYYGDHDSPPDGFERIEQYIKM